MARLIGKRLAFVEHLAQGKSCSQAARDAGYSRRYARQSAYQLMEDAEIKAAVAEIQGAAKERTKETVEKAIRDADELITEAREHKQMTAVANLFQTKHKLTGFLKERVEIAPALDLLDAINAGRTRAGLPVLPSPDAPQIIDVTAREVNEPVPVPQHEQE